jgi:aspartyl-tRNA synthetase
MKRILTIETDKYIGKKIMVCGWVQTVRSHGKIIFVDLRDRSGILQIVFNPKTPEAKTPEDSPLYKLAKELRPEWVIEIEGIINKRPKGMENPKIETGEIELKVENLKILSKAKTLPLPIFEIGKKEPTLEKRMNWRWLDLRKPEKQLIFKVWTVMEQAFREYWISHGYIQIHSPKLMSVPSESGAELFEVKYFNRKAYLAQSPQFYKQMAMAAGFEKVFEVGPVFRANPSFTSRHDTEFTGYDVEISFIESHQDIIQAEEEALVSVLTKIKEEFGKDIEKFYGRKIVIPKIPFPQLTMEEAKKILSKLRVKSEKDGDLSPEEGKKLSEFIREKKGHEFIFVTEYPIEFRPFYHMRLETNPKLTKSFDLLWNGLEITTGAQREHRYEILAKQAKEKGLKLESIKYYLNFFKYGCPPHGGFGLGPTRMLMKVFNIRNVREVTYLYRGVKRLIP